MALDYKAYEDCFNTGDDEALVERFFDEDLVFSGGNRTYEGKQGLLDFLRWAHDGVREVMRPQLVLQQGDHIFAEIDMDFHASKERPEFPFGHLHPGDMVTVKFFVTYLTRDDKVVRLKSMTWPPDRGVSKLPRLGAHPSQLAAFHSYVAAFSNGDPARFTKFYHPDVVLELGSVPTIHGADGIAAFYGEMYKTVRESLVIHSVEASNEVIKLDATARFTAVEDAPDFVVGAMQKGDYIEGRVFVDYTLRDGLIASIGVRRGEGGMTLHRASASK